MRAFGWWAAWTILAGYRAWQLVYLISVGNVIGWFLLVPEALALYWGIQNAFVSKSKDYRLVGLWVPLCYAAGVFVISSSAVASSPASLAVFFVAEGLSVWALLCLRSRFSVAGSAWVSLCDRGPYKWIRHPQLAARVLFILACTVPVWNWFGMLIALVMTVSVVLIEEGHLMQEEEYRDYSMRVEHRLIPGVF